MLTYKEIDELIKKGGEILWYESNSIVACDLWLEAWEGIKQIMIKESLVDIAEVDELYDWDDYIEYYVQDLELELHNAGIDDGAYFEKRLVFARELIERCSISTSIRNKARRAVAEAYIRLEKFKEAEGAFEKLIEDEPNWSWGYFGWADYFASECQPARYDKAAEILEKGLEQSWLDERENLQECAEIYFEELDDGEKITPYGAKLRRLAEITTPLELDQAFHGIMKIDKKFAGNEVWCIREHRDVSIPRLLEFVKEATSSYINAEECSNDLVDHMYAMYLLAEFKEHRALPLFLEILELDNDTCRAILGDTLSLNIHDISLTSRIFSAIV